MDRILKMRSILCCVTFLILASAAAAQSPDGIAPVTIEARSWSFEKQAPTTTKVQNVHPAKEMTVDDTPFERKAREAQVRGSLPDPGEISPDGRRAQLDKIADDAQTSKVDGIAGYRYRASIRNNSTKSAAVVYWEYSFAEIADPRPVVRRQFLCSVNLKPGSTREVDVFSALGPSDVVKATGLGATSPSFREEAFINRVEFTDDEVIQRRGWNFAEVKKSVERVTSTRWAPNETCRPI